MGVSINQYRARVGGYHKIALELSTRSPYFCNTKNILVLIILYIFGSRGLSLALLLFFCVDCCNQYANVHISTLTKNESKLTDTITAFNVFFPYKFKNYSNQIVSFLSPNLITLFVFTLLLLLCGDIHPNPGPPYNNSNLSIVHNNICSLEHKTLFIEAELSKFDIITLSETWLYDGISNENIHINGYLPPIRRDTPGNAGYRGVAIYVKEDLICKHRPDLEVQDLEAVWLETKVNQETLLVGCFYRAPDTRVGYWELIDNSISKAINTPHK